MIREYTFQDWLSGKICLTYASIELTPNQKDMPLIVNWSQIVESDINIIKQQQNKIFEELVIVELTKMKSQYVKDIALTRSPINLLERLIAKFEEILFEGLNNISTLVTIKSDNTVFEYNQLLGIKNYTTDYILLAKEMDYSFVQAPMCKFHNSESLSPQIEAEIYYRFLTWLKEKKQMFLLNNESEIQSEKIKWRADIFIDQQHFIKAKKIMDVLIKNNSKITGHSYVYQILRKNKFFKDIKQSVYIEFLKEEYAVNLNGNKISSKKPKYLQELISRQFPELSLY